MLLMLRHQNHALRLPHHHPHLLRRPAAVQLSVECLFNSIEDCASSGRASSVLLLHPAPWLLEQPAATWLSISSIIDGS